MATILFIVPRFHTNLVCAVRALVRAGHRVELAVERIGRNEDHSDATPIPIRGLPARAELEALATRIRPDLVFLRGRPDFIALANAAMRSGRRREVAIYRYDQRPMTRLTSRGRRIRNWLAGRPALRITPVPGLDATGRRDPMAVYLPFPVEQPGRAVEQDGPVRVLCVGKLAQPRKNQHLVVEAMERIAAPGARLTLAGSTSTEINGVDIAHGAALRDRARAADWIDLCEDVPFDRMAALYAQHHVTILPSSNEPHGAAPLEAMAFGSVPVVSIQAGSAGLVEHGVTGLRVDPARDGEIAAALGSLIGDEDLRRRLSKGARDFALTELSPERYVARVEALLPRP